MRDLSLAGIIIGVICTLLAAILVLSGGKIIAVGEGWARAAGLAFLFSIACSQLPNQELPKFSDKKNSKEKSEELEDK